MDADVPWKHLCGLFHIRSLPLTAFCAALPPPGMHDIYMFITFCQSRQNPRPCLSQRARSSRAMLICARIPSATPLKVKHVCCPSRCSPCDSRCSQTTPKHQRLESQRSGGEPSRVNTREAKVVRTSRCAMSCSGCCWWFNWVRDGPCLFESLICRESIQRQCVDGCL